jgi:hypothetical protein
MRCGKAFARAAQRLASAARRRVGTALPKLEKIIAHPDAENRGESGESAARGVGPQRSWTPMFLVRETLSSCVVPHQNHESGSLFCAQHEYTTSLQKDATAQERASCITASYKCGIIWDFRRFIPAYWRNTLTITLTSVNARLASISGGDIMAPRFVSQSPLPPFSTYSLAI